MYTEMDMEFEALNTQEQWLYKEVYSKGLRAIYEEIRNKYNSLLLEQIAEDRKNNRSAKCVLTGDLYWSMIKELKEVGIDAHGHI